MKSINRYLFISLLLVANNCYGQSKKLEPELKPVKKWFDAWQLVSKKIYAIDTINTVEFVFFDDEFVYSTSAVSVPDGTLINGPGLFGKNLVWKKNRHNGFVVLPDGQQVPTGLMSFSAPLNHESATAFFVMPLPVFWKAAGVNSIELGLDNMVTGVFLHEFSHSQQMQNFGIKMTAFEQEEIFAGRNFTDDIIQENFEDDSLYTARFRLETEMFYKSALAKGKKNLTGLVKIAMQQLESRQSIYFSGERNLLKQVDDLFLTMEGVGQYSMYAWLIHPEGANLSRKNALAGVRRGGKWWSQEEGLALFLVLNRFSTPDKWGKYMFGSQTVSVADLINAEL